jgi:2-succinyl-5-enolpyruvyl-6-hydroxy-3-cyclohexene-1-carboxylate synthase
MVNLNSYWSTLIVEELVRQGCNYFCISPGSRSTPLTVAIAQNSIAKSNIFYDERGSAFHSLGYARATGKPSVLLCTSGTAVANYFPAIIEAYKDSIPLIVLTADRPPELRATGANQTIDQVKIFGNYLNWYFEIPTPDQNISPQFILTTIDQAYYRSINSPKGPIHINCLFREPYYKDNKIEEYETELICRWKKSIVPFTTFQQQQKNSLPGSDLIHKINHTKRGIIIAGKMDNPSDSKKVLELAKVLGWPIFADITSGLRIGENSDFVIEYFDLLLLSNSFKVSLKPEMIIQFGKRFVSKRLLKYLDEFKPEKYVLVDNSPNRYDPIHIVSDRFEANISLFCASIFPNIQSSIDKSWYDNIQTENKKICNLLEEEFEIENLLSEISIAQNISSFIPDESGLFLANSMPVRDMDMFAKKYKKSVSVAANRGVSGIDGTIASSIGFAQGSQTTVTLIIGDLAFIHDLNSLHQLTSTEHPVVIIVLNNRGGGIFSFLPISEQNELFEKYFTTPHELNFRDAASLFNIDYYLPDSNKEFLKYYESAIQEQKSTIIEITIDRNKNFTMHKEIFKKIVELLEK